MDIEHERVNPINFYTMTDPVSEEKHPVKERRRFCSQYIARQPITSDQSARFSLVFLSEKFSDEKFKALSFVDEKYHCRMNDNITLPLFQ